MRPINNVHGPSESLPFAPNINANFTGCSELLTPDSYDVTPAAAASPDIFGSFRFCVLPFPVWTSILDPHHQRLGKNFYKHRNFDFGVLLPSKKGSRQRHETFLTLLSSCCLVKKRFSLSEVSSVLEKIRMYLISPSHFLRTKKEKLTAGSDKKTAQPRRVSNQGLPNASSCKLQSGERGKTVLEVRMSSNCLSRSYEEKNDTE